jgi:hypothetical protein
MNQPQDDEPLDPQVEAIRKRLVRLLAVSGGIMVLGLLAVIIAVIYRLGGDSDSVEPPVHMLSQDGAPIVTHLEIDGERVAIILRYPAEGRSVLRIQTLEGTVISETELR